MDDLPKDKFEGSLVFFVVAGRRRVSVCEEAQEGREEEEEEEKEE